jgi:hypothetical protein
MLTPEFVSFGTTAPPHALGVDGAVAGAAAIYSHWQGDHTTPPELAADTSTGMLVRAAADPARWLAPFETVCNNHIDGDGVLSVLCALRPDLALAHAPRLIAAATAGDFSQWTGATAFDLLLRVHQLINRVQATGPGWEQRVLEAVGAEADALLTGSWPGEATRANAIADVEAAIDRLIRTPPSVHGRLAMVRWRRQIGHCSDLFTWLAGPFARDDLPLPALATAIAPTHFQLLCEETAEGWQVQLDAPRHSWARTVDLPAVVWPDLTAVAQALAAREPAAGWVCRPGAGELGFTCLLGAPRPSRLAPETLIEMILPAL